MALPPATPLITPLLLPTFAMQVVFEHFVDISSPSVLHNPCFADQIDTLIAHLLSWNMAKIY